MATINWPDALPLANADQNSYTPGNNVLQSNMANGKTKTRKISTSADDTMRVFFTFDAVEAALFEGWFSHYANDGDNWITMPVKVGAGVISHHVKFMAPQQAMTSLPGGRFRKDATLIIQKRQVIDSDLTDYLMTNSLYDLEAAANTAEGLTL